jgi:hypothetical protein
MVLINPPLNRRTQRQSGRQYKRNAQARQASDLRRFPVYPRLIKAYRSAPTERQGDGQKNYSPLFLCFFTPTDKLGFKGTSTTPTMKSRMCR